MTKPYKQPSVEISSLRAFLLTSRTGSTTAAAKDLDISQPAISSSIRRLETLAGTRLFDRTSRPMQLTMAGRQLKSRLEPLIENLDNLVKEMKSITNSAAIDLRISFSDSFGICVAPHIMPKILPSVCNLVAYCQNTPKAVQKLLDDEADIAVATKFPSEDPKVSAQMLLTENFLVVTPREYEGRINHISDLSSLPSTLPVIRFNDDSLDSVQIERVLRQCNFVNQNNIAVDTNQSAVSFVAHGLGWTVMPPLGLWVAKDLISRVSLHRIESLRATRSLYILHKSSLYSQLVSQIYKESQMYIRDSLLPTIAKTSPLLASSISLSDL